MITNLCESSELRVVDSWVTSVSTGGGSMWLTTSVGIGGVGAAVVGPNINQLNHVTEINKVDRFNTLPLLLLSSSSWPFCESEAICCCSRAAFPAADELNE